MPKYILPFLFTIFATTAQTNIKNITINPDIKKEVDKRIEEIQEFKTSPAIFDLYANSIVADLYENDSLYFSNTSLNKRLPFKCFYLWQNNSLGINGSYGIFGGTGFYINIKDNEATLYHMLSADDFPMYAYTPKDKLIMRLEVPCTETKIVLSEIPDQSKKQVIYGYVEFKSHDYYSAGGAFAEGEVPDRKKCRSDMKIYFRSSFLNIPE